MGSILLKVTSLMMVMSILAGALILGLCIRDERKIIEENLIRENIRLAEVAAKSIETGYIANTWPFRTLKQINESKDVLFWWVVKPDGVIYLADDASMFGRKIENLPLEGNGVIVKDYIYFKTGERIKIIIQPIDIGKAGELWALYIGLSLRCVEDATNNIIMTSIGYFGAIIVLTTILSFWLAREFTKPIIKLTKVANAASMGKINDDIDIKSKDEIGDLGESIKRMIASLKIAIMDFEKIEKEKK